MIEVGTQIPSIKVKLVGPEGASEVDTAKLLGSGRHVLFSVPGAFTPTCSNNHLPGFVEQSGAIKSKGIDRLICLAVNDPHVVKAWGGASDAFGKVEFIADGNADLARALGIERDMSGGAMGVRASRTAFVVKDGIVEAAFTEDKPGVVTSSGAPAIVEYLG